MKSEEGLSMVPKGVVLVNTEASQADISLTNDALKHKSIISVDWTPEEQSLLEDLLSKYASTPSIARYAMIVSKMKNKTVRDVALRCKWMTKMESAKRSTNDDLSNKRKDKKVKVENPIEKSPSYVKIHPKGLPYQLPVLPMDTDEAIGGVTGDLFAQNEQMFNQVLKNFSTFQLIENVNILQKVRDNILALNNLSEMPQLMNQQMPPLHVKVKEEKLAKISLIRDQWSSIKKKCP